METARSTYPGWESGLPHVVPWKEMMPRLMNVLELQQDLVISPHSV